MSDESGYKPPQQGEYKPPQQGEYKPPQQGEYKPPQPGEYKPPQPGEGYKPQQGGEYNKEKQPYEPPPPPPHPCPDPCGEDKPPRTGPPKIDEKCCPPHLCCPEGEKHCCTWEEVDDPCVRASACTTDWAIVNCKCQSENEKCCEEWDCGGYPQGTCVPCEPCKDLIPDPGDNGGCNEPPTGDCTSENLSKQLDALNRCISFEQSQKVELEARIKARDERATALKELIKSFDDIIKKYREQRFKLICKEDCLKGFYRDVSAVFDKKYPDVKELTDKINYELCQDELAKCCQKNLEGKLTKVTKLIWEQQQAETTMKKADQAFAIIKDLPKWIEDRFKELETLRDEIDKALNDEDPEKHKWAFYLFYWKFVPKFCKCFPFPFCCEPEEETSNQDQYQKPAAQTKEPLPHLGCKPGDWHPSAITEDSLKALICCASEYARKRKEDYLNASKNVANTNANLAFIKKKVEDNAKTLEDRIKNGLKSALEKAEKPASTSA